MKILANWVEIQSTDNNVNKGTKLNKLNKANGVEGKREQNTFMEEWLENDLFII